MMPNQPYPGPPSGSDTLARIERAIVRTPALFWFGYFVFLGALGAVSYMASKPELLIISGIGIVIAALSIDRRAAFATALVTAVALALIVMLATHATDLVELSATGLTAAVYCELIFRGRRAERRKGAEIEGYLRELSLLEQIRTSIARELDDIALGRVAVEAIRSVLGYAHVAVYRREGELLRMLYQVGWPEASERVPITTGALARSVQTGQPQLVSDTSTDSDRVNPSPGTKSEIAVPIFDGALVIGGINVETSAGDKHKRLDKSDLRQLVAVAQEIGLAMSRARLHAAVERDRDQQQQIMRALGQALCVYDKDGRPVYVNAAFERLLGWTLEEVRALTLEGLVEPGQMPRLRAEFMGWRTGTFGSSELQILARDGRWIPFIVTTSPRSLSGAVEGGVATLIDLSDIKRSQQALVLSEQQQRRLFLEADRHRRVLEARDQVSTALALEIDPRAIGPIAVEAIARSLAYAQVTIYTLEGESLVMQHQRGWAAVLPRFSVSMGVMGRAIRTRQTQYVPRVSEDPDYINALPEARSAIAAPIFDRDELVGVLNVETTARDSEPDLGPSDLALIGAVAEQIGVAYGRARLYAVIQRERDLNAQIMGALGQGLVIFDDHWKAEYINPAFTQLLGWNLAELSRLSPAEFVAETDQALFERAFAGAVAGQRQSLEINVRHRDGSQVPVYINTSPRSLNAVSGSVAVFTDLRPIRETQRALGESEMRFRQLYLAAERGRRELEVLDKVRSAITLKTSLEAVFEAVAQSIQDDLHYDNVLIYRVDRNELILQCGRSAAEMPPRAPLGNVSRLAVMRREPIFARDVRSWSGLNVDPTFRSHVCIPLMLGEAVFGLLSVLSDAPRELDDADMRILTIIGENLSMAISRAQLFVDLEGARDQALYASRAKSEFLTMMSHELRTPLNVILGSAELLRDGLEQGDLRELAQMAEEAGENLLDIINDVLDLARIEVGKVDLHLGRHPIGTIARATVRLLEAQASAKSIRLIDTSGGDEFFAVCDPKRARQVLLNLVANAIKFTDSGQVEVNITKDGERVTISVTDTGTGIQPEGLARLFRPFTQVDSSTTRRFGGTGLGLAISKQLVELMDGEIGVRSEPGKGSTFWFTLPVGPLAERIITT